MFNCHAELGISMSHKIFVVFVFSLSGDKERGKNKIERLFAQEKVKENRIDCDPENEKKNTKECFESKSSVLEAN